MTTSLLIPLHLRKSNKNDNYNVDGHIGPISMPIDIDQCPDIFIYLCLSSNNKRISYLRMPFKTIFNKQWKNPPKWYHLREDKVINGLNNDVLAHYFLH